MVGSGSGSKIGGSAGNPTIALRTNLDPHKLIRAPLKPSDFPAKIVPAQSYQQQQFNNLTADIMAKAPKTSAQPPAASSVYFNTGGDINSAKANVKSWQILLNQKGYRDKDGNKLAEDGIWGPKTEYAWLSYQQAQGEKVTATGSANYTQNQIKEGAAAIANNQLSNIFKAPPATPARSWTKLQQANDPILKKLEAAIAAEPRAKAAFSSPEEIRKRQEALNALGFTGPDGKKLPENGKLDLNTVVAYDQLIHNGSFFGNVGSPITKVLTGKDGTGASASTIIGDLATGMFPSTSVISPLQSDITNITKFINNEGNYLLRYQDGPRVLMIDKPGTLNGKSIGHHINTMTYPEIQNGNFNAIQKKVLTGLSHKEIPTPVYEAFHNFDDVTKVVKNGGKALGAVGIAFDAYELGSTIYIDLNDEDQKLGQETVATAVGIGGSWAGGLGGAKLGAMGGAAIGTLICPGLGTVIGGFIGGIGGGVGGAMGGRAAGEWVVEMAYEK